MEWMLPLTRGHTYNELGGWGGGGIFISIRSYELHESGKEYVCMYRSWYWSWSENDEGKKKSQKLYTARLRLSNKDRAR